MKCDADVAAVLTRLASYQGHLPTGSPMSPIMAYFAHYDVWEAIAAKCREHNYRLTVYIDDVTISGASLNAEVMWEIKRTIHRSGLRYHKEKTFIDRPAEITGVIVKGDRLLPPNRQHKKLHETTTALRTISAPTKALQERKSGLQGQMAQIAAV
jgi:hypothetical protein